MRGSTHTKYSLEKLFSKLRSSLPPEKIKELAKLYDVYRVSTLGDFLLALLSSISEVLESNFILVCCFPGWQVDQKYFHTAYAKCGGGLCSVICYSGDS